MHETGRFVHAIGREGLASGIGSRRLGWCPFHLNRQNSGAMAIFQEDLG